jgi:Ca2+-binding EF-hand superfamily protein
MSKHINISESHKSNNSHNFNNNVYEDNNNIMESFSDKINRETLNKKIKEYNNTSLINFIKYIQYLVKCEKKTIGNKDQLSLREDISLKELFCIFDYNKKNNISKNEFKIVCKKIFGLYPTSDQIILVFKRYDKNKDDNLNLREFLGMIKPLKEEYASFLFNKKKNETKNEGYQQLSMKSKKLLVEVVRGIIEDEGNYYKFKDDMINQNLFELNALWENISKYSNNNKGLDKLEMNKLLTDNGCSLSQYDLDVLFNKMDYDDDQVISYEDLTEEFVNYY